MAAPKVTINLQNGVLGQVANTEDGVAGLVATGIAASGLALSASAQIFSLADAEALGINSAYDTTNTTNVWKTIKDFYAQAGTGKELWIMIVAKTTTMATICDTASSLLKKLLNDAQGRIKIVGITRVPDGSYVPAPVGQLDPDVLLAAAKLQALYTEFKGEFKPFRALLDGRDFQGNTGTLTDLKGSNYNAVAVVLGTDVSGSDNAAVGLALGRLAANPVQRNIGRVKDGDLGVQAAFLTGQTTDTKTFTLAQVDAVHDKGYIFLRKYQGKNGYFFNDDPTATANTDDYSTLTHGRVIDKAIVLAYTTYIDEILDEVKLDENGKMLPGVIKSYQAKVKAALDLNMTAKDEVSAVRVVIDPTQDVLTTNKVKVDLFITPVGYAKEIEVNLGFDPGT